MIFRYIRQKQSQLLHCANVSPGTLSSFSLGYCLIWFQPLASFQIMVFHWMPFFTVAVQNNHCRDCPACPDRWLCKRCYLLNLRVAGELAWMAGKLFLILNPTWNWQHYGSFQSKGGKQTLTCGSCHFASKVCRGHPLIWPFSFSFDRWNHLPLFPPP